jgi:phosphomannomutase
MSIFKAYDIRGIYPNELNEDTAYKIARAYADILKKELKKDNIKVVVGRDMRLSSPSLAEQVIKGFTDQGINVIDVGLVSTPTFYFAVAHYKYDGGIQVSASHNPKEYNGMKIVKAKAYPVSYETGINEIEKKVAENKFSVSKKKGSVSKKDNIIDEEVKSSLNYADIKKIKPFKIVADPANSMGALYLEKLFEKLPCKLIKMNFKLDGTFPSHQADPFKDENTSDLRKEVIKQKADLGIATDGDGDRIFFIDNKGELVEPGIVRGLLSKLVLKKYPGSRICYDIRPGKITYDMIVENGGIPSITKVGHSLIKAQAIKEGAMFAGESSGHFFLKFEGGFFEVPMIITLMLLEDISSEGKEFSQILMPLKRYFHSGEINLKVQNKEAKLKELAEKFKDAKKISWLDGISIEYDDFWFNVRASNTEPLLRLNLEAKTKKLMEEKKKLLTDLLN